MRLWRSATTPCTARRPTISKAASHPSSRGNLAAEAASLSASAFLCLAIGGCGGGATNATAVIGPAAETIRCVNTVSGAGWTIALDGPRGLADGRPAKFGARWVSWNDAAGDSSFALDRGSGALTITRGSSTGGWVATFACRA